MRRVNFLAAATIAFAAICGAGVAQTYPSHPITLIVPFPAGGGVDAVARIVGEKLASGLRQQVIIDNRGGVAGVIGMRPVAEVHAEDVGPCGGQLADLFWRPAGGTDGCHNAGAAGADHPAFVRF